MAETTFEKKKKMGYNKNQAQQFAFILTKRGRYQNKNAFMTEFREWFDEFFKEFNKIDDEIEQRFQNQQNQT